LSEEQKRKKRIEALRNGDGFTGDELRLLASLGPSAVGKVLRKALNTWREIDSKAILDEEVDLSMTQFHRGRLALLADFVLLLEEEAPRVYESSRRATAEKESRGE
jgi:hypothetical protein